MRRRKNKKATQPRERARHAITDAEDKLLPPSSYDSAGASDVSWDPAPLAKLLIFLKGVVGSGKSTLVASMANAFFFDFDNKFGGIKRLGDGSRKTPRSCHSWEDYLHWVDRLVTDGEKNRRAFNTIVLDPLTTIIRLIIPFLNDVYDCDDIREYGKGGAGWDKINHGVIGMIERFRMAGYGVVVVGHMSPRLGRTKDDTQWEHIAPPRVREYLLGTCHFTGEVVRESVYLKRSKKWVDRFFLDFDSAIDPDQFRIEARQYIPLVTPRFRIPEGSGWQALDDVYRESIEVRQRIITREGS